MLSDKEIEHNIAIVAKADDMPIEAQRLFKHAMVCLREIAVSLQTIAGGQRHD